MKKVVICVLTLIVASSLFATGQVEKKTAEKGAAMGKIEIHFFQFKPYLDEGYKEFAGEFEKQNPNAKVLVETVGGGTKWQTILKSKFAAGQGPDIFPIEGQSQYKLWKDHIADLSGESWIRNAVPFALKDLNINGKQMGMPVNVEGYGYIYNKDIFSKTGITDRPKTIAGLESAVKKIKNAGYTPFATGYATWWVVGLHLMNIPFAQQTDPKGFIKEMNNGSAKMSGNDMFQDLQKTVDLTVKYGEKNPLATDHNMQVQLLANGKAAMIQQGVWKEIPIYKANPNANIGLLPIPLNNDMKKMDRIPVGVPFYFVVNKNSSKDVQGTAKKFLNFLVNTKVGQSYMTAKFGFIPAYKGVEPKGLHGVGLDILKYSSESKVIPWVFGEFPDGYAQEAMNNIQAYIAKKQDWNTTLNKLDAAWTRLLKK